MLSGEINVISRTKFYTFQVNQLGESDTIIFKLKYYVVHPTIGKIEFGTLTIDCVNFIF